MSTREIFGIPFIRKSSLALYIACLGMLADKVSVDEDNGF